MSCIDNNAEFFFCSVSLASHNYGTCKYSNSCDIILYESSCSGGNWGVLLLVPEVFLTGNEGGDQSDDTYCWNVL